MNAALSSIGAPASIFLILLGVAGISMASWVGAVDTALSRMTLAYTEDLVEQGRRGAPALLVAVEAHKTRRTNLLTARAILQTMGMVALTLVTTIHVDNLGWPWWGVLLTTIAVVAIVQLLALGISTHLLSGSRYVSLALASSGFACWMMRLRRRSQETVDLQAGEEGAERIGESEARLLAADTLREIFDEVSEDGGAASLEEEDRKIIRSVFELGQTRVGEVMVPRSEMVTIRGDESARSALQLFVRSGYSRLPVVGKSLDEIQGVLYMKDVVRRWLHDPQAATIPVNHLCRSAAFVPEMKLADDELRVMQATNTHVALVVDEYGGIAGLITVEDILEELVGELTDEHDIDVTVPEEVAPGTWLIPTSYPIVDLEDLLETQVDEDEVYSAGGLLTKAIGKVPLPGASARIGEILLVAGDSVGRRRRVLTLFASQAPTGEERSEG